MTAFTSIVKAPEGGGLTDNTKEAIKGVTRRGREERISFPAERVNRIGPVVPKQKSKKGINICSCNKMRRQRELLPIASPHRPQFVDARRVGNTPLIPS